MISSRLSGPARSGAAVVALLGGLVATFGAGCDSCAKGGGSTAADAETSPQSVTLPDASPANATVLPAASIAKVVNPQGLPPYTGPTGSVEGTITVVGDFAPETPADFHKCPDAEAMWGHQFREGSPTKPGGPRALGDAVVGVTGYSGYYVPEKSDAKTITIEGCAYKNRTVTMTFGQALDVKNLSTEYWTPLLLPGGRAVLRMASPKGDPVRLYPKEPGHYLVTDHDRKYAVVDLYVLLHPLHAVTNGSGAYRIDNVPVGKLKVSTTHPRLAGAQASADVEIAAGVVHHLDLQLTFHKPEAGAGDDDAGPYPVVH